MSNSFAHEIIYNNVFVSSLSMLNEHILNKLALESLRVLYIHGTHVCDIQRQDTTCLRLISFGYLLQHCIPMKTPRFI